MWLTPHRRWLGVVIGGIFITAVAAALVVGWLLQLPQPGSQAYEDYVRAFQVGEAAADTDQPELAREKLLEAIALVPTEPAAHADLGLLELRSNNIEEAELHLLDAQKLAPNHGEIEAMLGHLRAIQGRYPDAIQHFRQALHQLPNDLKILYALAQVIEKESAANADEEYRKLIARGLEWQPSNLRLLREHILAAIRAGDRAAVLDTLKRYRELAGRWQPETIAALNHLQKSAEAKINPELMTDLNVFDNMLKAEHGYLRSAQAVEPDQKAVGELMSGFVRLKPISPTPAPPDLGLTYRQGEPLPAGKSSATLIPVWLKAETVPAVFSASGSVVHRADVVSATLSFPGGKAATPPAAAGLVAFDWNNDLLPDLLCVGAGGLRFYQGNREEWFTDVTDRTGLPADVLSGDYYGAWPFDIEADGDLDIVLAPRDGAPFVLRNNGDGTWTVSKPFGTLRPVRGFAWGDFDHDGAPDVAFLDDQGAISVFANERLGQYRLRSMPAAGGAMLALAVADIYDKGQFSLLALRAHGTILSFTDQEHGSEWQVSEVAKWQDMPENLKPGEARLLRADLDNNGAIDLVATCATASAAWLAGPPGKFTPIPGIPANVFALVDRSGQGYCDLLTVDAGQPTQYVAVPKLPYKSMSVWPQATPGVPRGDNRINSHGIGGTLEIRSGRLTHKQLIEAPQVRSGLGTAEEAQVIRIEWPNGTFQVEFGGRADRALVVEQRLKGSCPFLFADDGKGIQFISDFLWSSPLGMYINGQDNSAAAQTTDWVTIRGEQLAARAGYYDLRINANLWETHFIDHVHLKVVDHPAYTEMYVDERFALTPMVPQIYLTKPSKPVVRAVDDRGADVTDLVRAVDGRYVDTFGLGTYQGLTRDHWIEVDIDPTMPTQGPVYLLATGWIHPTDSSLNVAIGQNHGEPPSPLSVEVPDGRGGWKPAGPPLGFPAGKNKTMVIRLDGLDGPKASRRVRLRTNLEIYWDRLATAVGVDASLAKVTTLLPETAQLRSRGILEMTRAHASAPELPNYDRVIARNQYWRDLIGYHTRFGDVRELLDKIDDRYVILNAGDDLQCRFAAPPTPPDGIRRDFVWVADGWEKDGDFNTRASKTVLPLPFHGMKSYAATPGRLQDDPVYRRFPEDWQRFHTRYVTPAEFERGLQPTARGAR